MKITKIRYECGCVAVVDQGKRIFIKRCPIWFPCRASLTRKESNG